MGCRRGATRRPGRRPSLRVASFQPPVWSGAGAPRPMPARQSRTPHSRDRLTHREAGSRVARERPVATEPHEGRSDGPGMLPGPSSPPAPAPPAGRRLADPRGVVVSVTLIATVRAGGCMGRMRHRASLPSRQQRGRSPPMLVIRMGAAQASPRAGHAAEGGRISPPGVALFRRGSRRRLGSALRAWRHCAARAASSGAVGRSASAPRDRRPAGGPALRRQDSPAASPGPSHKKPAR